MNVVKELQRINALELSSGLTGSKGSWHEEYRSSCWVFVGNLATNLTEGDVLAVMSQYGEIDDVHLLRVEEKKDKGGGSSSSSSANDPWGKKDVKDDASKAEHAAPVGSSRGSCFVKYSEFESCILAVDNLCGATLLGRTMRVDHVKDYRGIRREEGGDDDDKEASEGRVGPGQAYVGKKLANEHDIHKGVDLFAGKPEKEEEEEEVENLKGYELVDEDDDDDLVVKKEKSKEKKESKKAKKESKKDKKESKKEKKDKKDKKEKKEKKGKSEKKEKRGKDEKHYSSDSASSSEDSEGSSRKRRRLDSD